MSTEDAGFRRAIIGDLSERVGRDLATKVVIFHHAVATSLGLSATDLKCLDLLAGAGAPMTATNLAAATGLTGGAITGVADRLEAAGFVERVRDPTDRRRWELRPIPERQDEVIAHFAPLAAAMSALCDHYDNDQLAVIGDFLTGLGAVMDDQIERFRATPSAAPT